MDPLLPDVVLGADGLELVMAGARCDAVAAAEAGVLAAASATLTILVTSTVTPLTLPTLVQSPAAAWKSDRSVRSAVEAHVMQPLWYASKMFGAHVEPE